MTTLLRRYDRLVNDLMVIHQSDVNDALKARAILHKMIDFTEADPAAKAIHLKGLLAPLLEKPIDG